MAGNGGYKSLNQFRLNNTSILKKQNNIEDKLYTLKLFIRYAIQIPLAVSFIFIVAYGYILLTLPDNMYFDYYSEKFLRIATIVAVTLVIFIFYKYLDKKYPDIKEMKINPKDRVEKSKWYQL